MGADLRVKLFEHLLSFDLNFYDLQRTGELSDTLNCHIQEFKSSFKMSVIQGLKSFSQISGCLASMYLVSPKMTLIMLTALPVFITIGSIFGAILRHVSLQAQEQGSLAAVLADEALQNIRTVKSFAMEETEKNLYRLEVEKTRLLNEKLGIGIALFQSATSIFLNGLVLAVLYGGGKMIMNEELSPGELISFLTSSQLIQKSLAQLSLVFGNGIRAWTSCARLMSFLKMEPTNLNGTVKIPFHSLLGEINFRNVSFSYPSRPDQVVIDKMNLKIEAGKTIAICGSSGSGKSTVALLMKRLYEPQEGEVTLDGVNLKTIDPNWLRKSVIGVISQEPILFATTIKENIRYGRPEATDEDVKHAAELANASFIGEFPNGYETLVGERGITLSGGQKQRIAIARALLKDPPILILDEATSALDSESERKVQEALDLVMANKTVIIIAHRLSTIRNADFLYVLRDGIVVEKGTHSELLERRGHYYDLFRTQSSQPETSPVARSR